MESRKIIVVNSLDQNQYVFMSGAETLGQLKAELDAKGVNYSGMTFLEGHTKTEMSLNDAILPTNIPYRGTVTNDLVFLLTSPQKKIKSGYDRATIYTIIRTKNLSEPIAEKFGKNFTNVSTEDLDKFIHEVVESASCYGNDDFMSELLEVLKSFNAKMDALCERFGVDVNAKNKVLSDEQISDLFGDMLGNAKCEPEEEEDDEDEDEDC